MLGVLAYGGWIEACPGAGGLGGGLIVDSLEQEDGASLSEPHIEHDNSPRVWNNGMSVSFTPLLLHPGS